MTIQMTARPGYILGLAILVGTIIAVGSVMKEQRVLLQNKTELVLTIGTNSVLPGGSVVVWTTNDNFVHITATGTVKSGKTTNVWLGVELNKKLAPNATKVEISLDDFP